MGEGLVAVDGSDSSIGVREMGKQHIRECGFWRLPNFVAPATKLRLPATGLDLSSARSFFHGGATLRGAVRVWTGDAAIRCDANGSGGASPHRLKAES